MSKSIYARCSCSVGKVKHTVKSDREDYDLDIVTCSRCGLEHKHSLYISCGCDD